MSVVVVIQCGSAKLGGAHRADEMYVGSLFRMAKRAAIRIADRYYIVSAKYGLIRPSRVIVSYDAVLPAGGDEEWGARVLAEFRKFEPTPPARVVALCSESYCVGWAERVGAERPLRGLGMGYRLQFLNNLGRTR